MVPGIYLRETISMTKEKELSQTVIRMYAEYINGLLKQRK